MGWFTLFAILVLAVLYVLAGVRLLYQYERGVIFTLGKYSSTREPGLTWVMPFVQNMRRLDMRIKTSDIPRQEVITRDNIPILAATVVYFKVVKPEDAIIKIEDYGYAVRQYTQAALRDVVGNSELDHVLSEREEVAGNIRKIVDAETSDWGVDIEAIKIQEIDAEDASPAHVDLALRTLARLMVRRHRQSGDPVANGGDETRSAALTSSPHPSAHHGDEAA